MLPEDKINPPPDVESYLDPPSLRKIVRGADKLQGVQPDLLNHWNNLQGEFDKAGLTPEIKSGYRTTAQQQSLYNNPATRALTKGNDGIVNVSPHQEGRALDISFPATQRAKGRQIIANYAQQNGLHVPSDEPWHIAIPKQSQQDPYLAPLAASTPSQPVQAMDDPYLAPIAQQSPAPVAQPALKTPSLSTNDTQWHFGENIPNPSPRAMRVLQQAVAEDQRKKAAGQAIAPPPLAYQNQMRAKAGLKPLAMQSGAEGGQDVGARVGVQIGGDYSLKKILPRAAGTSTPIGADPMDAYRVHPGPAADPERMLRASKQAEVESEMNTAPLASLPSGGLPRDLAPVVQERTDEKVAAQHRYEQRLALNKNRVDAKKAYYRDLIQKQGGWTPEVDKWLTESLLQSASHVGDLLAGGTKIVGRGSEGSTFNRVWSDAEAMRQAVEEESQGRSEVSKTAQGALSGLMSPEIVATALGVPPEVAFGVGSTLGTVGQGGTPKEAVQSGLTNAAAGRLFKAPGVGENALAQAASKAGVVGAGTYALTGDPKSALTNAAFVASGALHGKGEPERPTQTVPDTLQSKLRGGEIDQTLASREAAVKPTFLRDDQGNPVARLLNPDEVAQGAKPKVRPIHQADTQVRDEVGKFAPAIPPQQPTTSEVTSPAQSAGTSAETMPVEAAQPAMETTASTPEINVPERPETIQAQLDQRGFSFIPEGEQRPNLPQGVRTLKRPEGTIYYDPAKVTDVNALRDTPLNDLLGHIEPKPAAGEPRAAVVARNPDGTEVQSSATSPENVSAQVAETQSRLPNTEVGVEPPEKVIGERLANAPETTGIANRVEQMRRDALARTEARRGEGITAEDSVNRGRQLLADGRDPQEAIDKFKQDGAISADSMALVRAKHEELAQAANRAFDEGGQKLNDPKFKAAEKARQDFWENSVRPMQTEWAKTGMAQQGETAIDTGTFYGIYRAFKQSTGREMTPSEEATAKQLASKVAGSDQSVKDVEKELIAKLNRAAGIKDLDPEMQKALSRFVDESRREARTQRRAQTRKSLDDEADLIKQNIAAEFAKLKSQAAQGQFRSAGGLGALDPDGVITKAVIKLAKNRVKAGITDTAQLVDDVHSAIKDFADVTKREVAEALTGVISRDKREPSDWMKAKSGIRQGLKVEDEAKAIADLGNRVAAGGKINPQDAKTLWRYANDKYIDKGVEFGDTVQKVAKDLGATPDQVRRALATQGGTKPLTDELYRKMAARRSARTQAESWVSTVDRSPAVKALEGARDLFFNLKTFGHGTVGPITHAGKNLFIPERWADYIKNVGRTWKAAYSSGAHERLMQDLVNDPNYTVARRAGLANEPGKFYDDYQNNQMQKLFGEIGKIGNRGFDVLKRMRQDFFNSQWNKLEDAQKTPEMAKAIADLSNHATGAIRTRIPFSGLTRGVLFAPSLEASRWASIFGDPARAINAFSNWSKAPEAEKYFAKQVISKHAQFLGTYLAALALNQGILSATKSDDKINFTDPSKGDWLRMKIAGRSIEPTGGIIGTIDFLGKLAAASLGTKRAGESRYETMGKAAAQYARGKLSPIASTAADVVSQADFAGKPLPFSSDEGTATKPRYTWPEYLLTQHTPIPVSEAVRDIYSSLDKQGVEQSKAKAIVKGIVVGALSGGTGVRIGAEYQQRPDQRAVKQGFQDRFMKGLITEDDLDRAAKRSELSQSDINSILKEKDIQDEYKTPAKIQFYKAPTLTANKTSTALERFSRMNEIQRAEVRGIMQDKADLLMSSDALTDEQKRVFAERLKKVGIDVKE